MSASTRSPLLKFDETRRPPVLQALRFILLPRTMSEDESRPCKRARVDGQSLSCTGPAAVLWRARRRPAPERVRILLCDVRVAPREVEVDVYRRTVACAAREPCVEVDEHRAREATVLERGVARDVRVAHGELRDLRSAGGPHERVDDEPGVVGGLDVWRRRGVDRGAVDDRAIQADGLDLVVGVLNVSTLYMAND